MTEDKAADIRPPDATCIHCGARVVEIDGKVVMRGKGSSHRHMRPPLGCPKGDPLFIGDVNIVTYENERIKRGKPKRAS